jgi:hypothetical protein
VGLILSEKLRNVPKAVREAFKDTNFMCDCGGTVLPFDMLNGVCIGCGSEYPLDELDYESDREDTL